jgi:hypothetical protein
MVWRENQFCRKIHGFSTLKNIFNSSTGVKAISCYTTSLVRDYSKLLFRVVETHAAVILSSHWVRFKISGKYETTVFTPWAEC